MCRQSSCEHGERPLPAAGSTVQTDDDQNMNNSDSELCFLFFLCHLKFLQIISFL